LEWKVAVGQRNLSDSAKRRAFGNKWPLGGNYVEREREASYMSRRGGMVTEQAKIWKIPTSVSQLTGQKGGA